MRKVFALFWQSIGNVDENLHDVFSDAILAKRLEHRKSHLF
jgi:hypothetical protein